MFINLAESSCGEFTRGGKLIFILLRNIVNNTFLNALLKENLTGSTKYRINNNLVGKHFKLNNH